MAAHARAVAETQVSATADTGDISQTIAWQPMLTYGRLPASYISRAHLCWQSCDMSEAHTSQASTNRHDCSHEVQHDPQSQHIHCERARGRLDVLQIPQQSLDGAASRIAQGATDPSPSSAASAQKDVWLYHTFLSCPRKALPITTIVSVDTGLNTSVAKQCNNCTKGCSTVMYIL